MKMRRSASALPDHGRRGRVDGVWVGKPVGGEGPAWGGEAQARPHARSHGRSDQLFSAKNVDARSATSTEKVKKKSWSSNEVTWQDLLMAQIGN
jgi:hypothetical protein